MLKNCGLVFTAFLQVMFVSMNVVFISRSYDLLLTLTGFLISFTWTFNVKKVVFGTLIHRFLYASGAALGTYVGFHIAKYLTTII